MTAIARVPLSLPLPLTVEQIQALIPQRFPMLMLDRVTLVEPDVVACGYKNLSINEPFFAGHFPQRPIMPGVLILEAMAQMAGVLLVVSTGRGHEQGVLHLFAGAEKVRFRRPVVPGDQLYLCARLLQKRQHLSRFACEAHVDDQLVAHAEILVSEQVMER
jgi:3-hydroxyacyl-[acyl-carrier-protein] dehydratase